MDYCGEVNLRNKCLDLASSSTCNGSNSQKYIYDSNTKSLRTATDPTLAATVVGSDIKLQKYANLATQKFLYDGSKFKLETQLTKCIDAPNDKMILSDCSTDLKMKKCSSVVEPVLQKMLDSLKPPAYDSIDSLLIKNKGLPFYISQSDTFSVVTVPPCNIFSLDTSAYSYAANSKVKLNPGRHMFACDVLTTSITFVRSDGKSFNINDLQTPGEIGDYYNVNPTPQSSSLSKYSDYYGCASKCGYDSETKVRELVPPLYSGAVETTSEPLEYTEECNKFCNTDAELFTKWKTLTSCPANVFPVSTKQLLIDDGAGGTFESALYIDKLKYSTDPTDLLMSWAAAKTPVLSSECHGNSLVDSAIMNKGARIYSKDSVSYLEFSDDGTLGLWTLSDTDYKLSSTIRSSGKGTKVKLLNGTLTFYEGTTSVASVVVTPVKCRIDVTTLGLYCIDDSNFVVKIVGEVGPTLAAPLKFKEGSAEYAIMKVDTSYVSLGNGYLNYVSNGVVIWRLAVSGYVTFGTDGIQICNSAGSVTYNAPAIGVTSYGISKENIEFYDSLDYVIRWIGSDVTMLFSGVNIRRPTIVQEESSIKAGSTELKFQIDGNLVLYKDSSPIWHSNTTNQTSTHWCIDKSGEIFVMNGTTVVYKSNFRDMSASSSMILILNGWAVVCTTISGVNYVSRLLPNSDNVDYMKELTKYYIETNYSKLPSYSVKFSTHTGSTSGYATRIPDMSSKLDISGCGAADFFCKYSKADNSGTFTITMTAGSEVVQPLGMTRTTAANTDYSFENKPILGYEELYPASKAGRYNLPKITLLSKDSIMLIKKDLESTMTDYATNDTFRNSLISSSDIKTFVPGYFGLDSFKVHDKFSLMSDKVSAFSNERSSAIDDIIQARVSALQSKCSGPAILSDNCQTELQKFDPAFKKETMELECRKDFNNKNCIEFMKESPKRLSFIQDLCQVSQLKTCTEACNNTYLNAISCVDPRTVQLIVLFVLVVLVTILIVIKKTMTKTKKSNTNAHE